MIVYVDVLVAINFLIDYLLLLISARLACVKVVRFRVAIAASIGALASLSIFLPPLNIIQQITFTSVLTLAMVVISGGFHDLGGFFKRLFFVLLCSLFYAGFIFMVSQWQKDKVFYQNGFSYFKISPVQFFIYVIICYLLLMVYQHLFKKNMIEQKNYQVYISYDGHQGIFEGVMDSQNNLIDFFTGIPVVIATTQILKDMVPKNILNYEMGEQMDGYRLIPCSTVAGEKLLPAFKPQKMVLISKDERIDIEEVYIAIIPDDIKCKIKKILLNPALCGKKEKTGFKNQTLFLSK